MRSKQLAITFLALIFAMCPTASWANVTYNISMDTSPLVGDPAAPFYLEFQFNDGSGTNDGNNTVLMDLFAFGAGGAAVGSPQPPFGGVTGDLSTSVAITDSDFFNQFIQQFTPGSLLTFRLSLSTNVDSGGVPDEFSFAILDSAFTEIPTLGFFDVFLLADIDSSNPLLTGFASDTSRNSAGGEGPINLAAPVITTDTAVPEPSTLSMLAAAMLLVGLRRRIQR